MKRKFSKSSLVALVSISIFSARTLYAENWIPLNSRSEGGFLEYWEYDKDSIFVDKESGYVVVMLWDEYFESTTGVAIDCVNMRDYFAVLSDAHSYDVNWRQQEKPRITPGARIYDFTQEYCPIRNTLRVGAIK
jgi:hypothetical protein